MGKWASNHCTMLYALCMRDGIYRKRNSRGVNELRAMIFIAFKCIIY
jgi:hypothetical protein